MEKLLPFIIILISKVNDNIEELYRDEEFYIQVFWWCIPLIVISMIFGRVIYLKLKKKVKDWLELFGSAWKTILLPNQLHIGPLWIHNTERGRQWSTLWDKGEFLTNLKLIDKSFSLYAPKVIIITNNNKALINKTSVAISAFSSLLGLFIFIN